MARVNGLISQILASRSLDLRIFQIGYKADDINEHGQDGEEVHYSSEVLQLPNHGGNQQAQWTEHDVTEKYPGYPQWYFSNVFGSL